MRFLLNVSDAHQKFIIQDRKKFDCTLHGYGMDTKLKKKFRVAEKKSMFLYVMKALQEQIYFELDENLM